MKKTYHISGMSCTSCEIVIEKHLKKLKHVKMLSISHKKGLLDVEYKNKKQEKDIENCICSCGYEIVSENKEKKSKSKNTFDDYLNILSITIILLFVFYFLSKANISKFFPEIGDNVSIAVALLIGLVASISTCLALVGGIVISFGSLYGQKEKTPLLEKIRPHVFFQAGRIGGFFLLGGILGLIGSKIHYSLSFTGWLTIFIGIVMAYVGAQILNIVPNISKLGFVLPKFIYKYIDKLEASNNKSAPFIIGALTFFIPCGFTQSMQLAAVASGSFFSGGFIMMAFALGTLPVLLSLGIGSTWSQKKELPFLKQIIGVVVLFFAFYSFQSGAILADIKIPSLQSFSKTIDSETSETKDGYQVIKMNVDGNFQPDTFTIKKNIPVKWEITGVNISGCTNEIIIPRLNISQKIEEGKTATVEFTPTETGILPFSCWMGMVHGKFIIY